MLKRVTRESTVFLPTVFIIWTQYQRGLQLYQLSFHLMLFHSFLRCSCKLIHTEPIWILIKFMILDQSKIEYFITNFLPYFPCTLLLSYDFIDSIIPPICLLVALSATFFQAQMMLMQVNWLDFNPDCFSIIHWKILTLLCNLKFKSLGIIEFPYSLSLWGITGGLTGFVSKTQSLTSNSC